MQNRSHAVMSQRTEAADSLDDFPTPPWATRALIEHVISNFTSPNQSCLEPACNRGFMANVLSEYFDSVTASDIHDYGFGEVKNFLSGAYPSDSHDWVITNPPFKYAEDFLHEALQVSRIGVAMLARTVFLESVGRYERLFSVNPPSIFAQFSERVPMFKGRLDPKGSTATGYAWFVWIKDHDQGPNLTWVPPCRRTLERDGDYEMEVRPMGRTPNASQRQTNLFGD